MSRLVDCEIAEKIMGCPKPDMPTLTSGDAIFDPIKYKGWLIVSSGYNYGDVPIIVPHAYSTDPVANQKMVDHLTAQHGPNGDHYDIVTYSDGIMHSAIWAETQDWEARYDSSLSIQDAIARAALLLMSNVKHYIDCQKGEPWIAETIEVNGKKVKIGKPFRWNEIKRG